MGNHQSKKSVVVTGMGVVSSLGNNKQEVWASLKEGRSGLVHSAIYKEKGMNCHVAGTVKFDDSKIDHRVKRTLGDNGIWGYSALMEAIADASLTPEMLNSPKTGIVAGTGVGSLNAFYSAINDFNEKGMKAMTPFLVNKIMGSSMPANFSTLLKTRGVSYGLSSACATGNHCIGHARDLILSGKQDIVLAGSSELEHWTMSIAFDAMRILSSKFNENPEKASRPFDKAREGIVLSGGAGFLILEDKDHALARGAKIYAEITGYGVTSDGFNLVAPNVEGPQSCMEQALQEANHSIDYINAHGTGTILGDVNELQCVKNIFKDQCPFVSSTKALSGHALGAAGSTEAVYSLLMMENNLLIGSANIENLEDLGKETNVLTQNKEMKVNSILSNSFGFGGTNCSVIFKKVT